MEKTYKNIHNSAELKKLEKKLIWEQRSLSRKYENLKKEEYTQKKKYTKSSPKKYNPLEDKNQQIHKKQ